MYVEPFVNTCSQSNIILLLVYVNSFLAAYVFLLDVHHVAGNK